MSGWTLSLATSVIVLLSSCVQSMTGFGFAVLAMPLLVVLIDPHEAVAISMVLSTLLVAAMWWRTRDVKRLPLGRRLYVPALFGLPAGVLALAFADLDMLRLGVGVVTLAIVLHVAVAMLQVRRARGAPAPSPVGPRPILLAGFLSGFLTGSISMPGPPVVALLSGQSVSKVAYRATLNAFFSLLYPIALLLMMLSGLVSAHSLIESLLHLPALVAGIWLGNLLHDAASEQLFAASSLAILAGAGAVCIWSSLGALWPQ